MDKLRKFSALTCFVLLLVCLGVTPASAWAPEMSFGTLDELPQEVQSELSPDWRYVYGMRCGQVVYVQMETPDALAVICIFRNSDGLYRLEQHGYLLPRQDGVKCGIGASGDKELYVVYQSGLFTWLGAFSHIEGNVWRLSAVQSDDMFQINDTGLSFYDEDKGDIRYLYGVPRIDLYLNPDEPLNMDVMPTTFKQACELIDTEGWAMIDISANDAQVSLRSEPSQQAAVLGQYYGGTPVRLLHEDGDSWWACVRIGATQEGYILRDSLAFGRDMLDVKRRFPSRIMGNEPRPDALEQGIPLYSLPDASASVVCILDEESIQGGELMDAGTYQEDWYIVMLGPDGPSGFIERKWFWGGNG
ncbi:MAG: SH3 domain-containing protein [Oscillospiraceae bacterium]|nr:SH3 domain-containing protein [Oscillospiraceae bacterium]